MMRKNGMGIQSRLMLAFTLILAGILFATGGFYMLSEQQTVETVIETYMGNLSYAGRLLSKEIKSLETAFSFLSTSPSVQRAVDIDLSDKQLYYNCVEDAADVIGVYFSRTGLAPQYATLRIFGENGIVLRDGGNMQLDAVVNYDSFHRGGWRSILDENPKKLTWLGVHPNPYYSDRIVNSVVENPENGVVDRSRVFVFGYIGNMYDNVSLKPSGVIYLTFYPSFFADLLENFDNSSSESTFIVDQHGNIIYGHSVDMIGSRYEDDETLRSLASETGYFLEGSGDDELLTAYCPITEGGWYLIKQIQFSEITSASRLALLKNISILSLISTVALLMWYIILRRLIQPIKTLSSAMESVQEGNLLVQVDDESRDEIGILTRNFNYMTDRINRLFHQLVEEQNQKKQMEFIALQAQLNPHFLQNTLNSIRWMAMIQRAASIKELTDALSRLLINVTSKVDRFVTIGEEIRILQDYIYIQKIRYGEKFNIWYQIDENLTGRRCLKFMLQPLLENAIYHGVEPKADKGNILLSIQPDNAGGRIRITVSDDGIGMSRERIRQVLYEEESRQDRQFSGIGIKNLGERIQLIYGRDYGIGIESEIGCYTSITIQLPLEPESGGESHA